MSSEKEVAGSYYSYCTDLSYRPPKQYKIDWEKVTELADVIVLLKALDIKFFGTNEDIEQIKHLLKPVEDTY